MRFDLNKILIDSSNVSIEMEQKEADEIIWTVTNIGKIVSLISRLSSKNESNSIVTTENVFKFLKIHYLADGNKAEIGIDTNDLEWKNSRDDSAMNIDSRNFTFKKKTGGITTKINCT